MSHILNEGDATDNYAHFKAFCDGTGAILIWVEHDAMLIVKARVSGHTVVWCSADATEKATFHTDYDASNKAYELGHDE